MPTLPSIYIYVYINQQVRKTDFYTFIFANINFARDPANH